MPFVDIDTQFASFVDPVFDVIIAGAGAAGILLAVRLTQGGKRVLLLESGHFAIDEKKQELNEVENVDKNLTAAVWGRKRAIGGTTLAWGGQALPFSPMDFTYRPWIGLSGWPIAFESLAGYYKEANSFMGIDTLNYHEDIFDKAKIKDPGIDAAQFDFHVSKWAPEPNFQLLYKGFLEKNVTVIYNAQLVKINRREAGDIETIEIHNFKKEKKVLPVKTLIIAAGGIETTRILLNNRLGDHSGWLGKCFMEHPCIEIADVITANAYALQRHFNTHIWQRKKYSVRLSLSKSFQEQQKTLNCSASFMFKPPEDQFDPYAELVAFKNDFKLSRLLKVSGSYKNIIKSIYAYFKDHFYYKVNACNKLVLMIEQEPVRESYIALSEMKDIFGLPKAKIGWHITHKTWETVLAISIALKKEIERLGLGEINLNDAISSGNKNWLHYLSDVNHHMGGCRMSSIKEDGVVNEDLQVWGIPNLYLCSTAIYPTSSHSNPTLTLLALGIRLSDHIIENKK